MSVEVRPHTIKVIAWIAAAAFVLIFLMVALLLRKSSTGVHFTVSDQVAMAGIGVLLAGGALWFTRPRVRANAEGVEVRNMLGTTWYPWEQVRKVSFPEGASWARLELADDEYAPVLAIQSMDGDRAVTAMRSLRSLHG